MFELSSVDRVFPGLPPTRALMPTTVAGNQGDFIAIMGRSGSGKSTMLNILGLLDRPTSGVQNLLGDDVSQMSDVQRSRIRASSIGFVFQSFHLMPYRDVIENVCTALLYGEQPRRSRNHLAMEALDRVGLSHKANSIPTRLSGGERQRVAVARAIVGSPSILLCDEPTGNLDSTSANYVLDTLSELNEQGLTVVVVTHDSSVASRARRLLLVEDGAVRES